MKKQVKVKNEVAFYRWLNRQIALEELAQKVGESVPTGSQRFYAEIRTETSWSDDENTNIDLIGVFRSQ